MCCEDGDKAFYICALLFCMGYFHNTHHEKKKKNVTLSLWLYVMSNILNDGVSTSL